MSTVNTNDPIDLLRRQKVLRELRRSQAARQHALSQTGLDDPNRPQVASEYQQGREDLAAAERGEIARRRLANPRPPRDINAARAQLVEQAEANLSSGPAPEYPTPEQVRERQRRLQIEAMRRDAGDRPLNQPGQYVAESDALRSIGGDVGDARVEAVRRAEMLNRIRDRFKPLEGSELIAAQGEEDESRLRRAQRDEAAVELGNEVLARPTAERIAVRRARENAAIATELQQQQARTASAQLRREEAGSATSLEDLQRQLAIKEAERQLQSFDAAPQSSAVVAELDSIQPGIFNGDELSSVLAQAEAALQGDINEAERRAIESSLFALRARIPEGFNELTLAAPLPAIREMIRSIQGRGRRQRIDELIGQQ